MERRGNNSLLNRHKIAFLAGSKIAPLSVLPTFDWATEVAKRKDVAIVSGFQSHLECQVLDLVLKGKCGIICVLARTIYKSIPGNFRDAYNSDRVLFISEFTQASYIRTNKLTAIRRNSLVANISDELVIPVLAPDSSLTTIVSNYKKPMTIL